MTAVFQTPCIIIPRFVDLVNESFEDTPFITNHDAITCYRLTCVFFLCYLLLSLLSEMCC